MDFQVVRENALKYLGYQAPMFEGLTLGISSLLGECIEEIEQIAQPKVIVKRFKLAKDPLRLEESGDEILGQQMEDMLEDCEECILLSLIHIYQKPISKPRGKYYHTTVDQEQCTWNSAGKNHNGTSGTKDQRTISCS